MNNSKNFIKRVIYNDDPDLILSPARKNMDKFIIQGMLGMAFSLLIGGVFLSGYLIYLGASDSLVSYITIIPNICGIFLVFFSTWMERLETRKRFLLLANSICKLLLISVIFVPLLAPKEFRVYIVFFLLIFGNILGCINNIAFNTWFTAIIPKEIKGRYFSVRQVLSVIIQLFLPILASWTLDKVPDPYIGFATLFLCSAVAGCFELLTFSRIDDVRFPVVKEKIKLISAFTIPIKNKEFLRYTIIVCLFHFFLFLGSSFTQIYQIRYLGLSYTFINVTSGINFALQIFVFYKFWGRVTDKINCNFTLVMCMGIYVLDMLLWSFVTDKTVMILLPLINIVASIEGPGFATGLFNRRFELIPNEGRMIYDSFFYCALGVALLLSPMAAGLLRYALGLFPGVAHIAFGSFRGVYFIAALLLLLLQFFNLRGANQESSGGPILTKNNFRYCRDIFLSCFIAKK